MKKIIRITTVPVSLKVLLKDQLKFMSAYFDVIAISSPEKELKEVEKNEKIKVIPLKLTRKITPLTDFISLIKLIRILKKERPNIVHTHTPTAGIIGMAASYFAQIPVRMHTVAGLPLTVATGFKRKLLVFIEKLTYACATNVYPNSKNLRNFISENKFCKKEKLKIIGKGSSNGIDTDYFKITEKIKKESEKIKKELKIPKNAFIYLFVGRIVKDKGINELINAFKKIKQKKDAYLILVGNYENNLNPVKKDLLNEIKNNENIVEAGYQTDVRPFFAMADVFVFPSYREGFPNVVMQAGAMEIPAIVSNINGCNEIIKDGKNGIIISVKNEKALYLAMNKIYTDTELRKKLKNNCRTNIIKNYERKYIWKELKNEYNNLLKLNNV